MSCKNLCSFFAEPLSLDTCGNTTAPSPVFPHFQDVRANFFCASLLSVRQDSHTTLCIAQMAITIDSFTWIHRSWWHLVTLIFLLIYHFLYRFSTFSKNRRKVSTKTLIFLQNAPSNSVLFRSSFICATVSNASWRVKFFCQKRCSHLEIFNQQNHFYKIWLRSL